MSKRIGAFVPRRGGSFWVGLILAASCLATRPARAGDADFAAEVDVDTNPPAARLEVTAPPRASDPFGIVVPPAPPRSHTGVAPDRGVTAKPFVHTHRVAAAFEFELEVALLIDADESPLYPWKAPATMTPQTRPVRSAVAVLEDDCGHYIKRPLSNSGTVTIDWTPAGCENATLTIWSVAPGDGRRVGVGRWIQGAVHDMSELSTSSGDYRPYAFARSFEIDDAVKNGGPGLDLGTVIVPFDDDASRGFFIMDNVQKALDYYESLPGVEASELPKVNVVHTQGLRPADVDCAQSASGLPKWDSDLQYAIYVPAKDPGFIFDSLGLPRSRSRRSCARPRNLPLLPEAFPPTESGLRPLRRRHGQSPGGSDPQDAVDHDGRRRTPREPRRQLPHGLLGRDGRLGGAERRGRARPGADRRRGPDIDECVDGGHSPVFPQASAWDPALDNDGWFQKIVWDLVDPDASEPEPVTESLVPGAGPGECDDCDAGEFDDVDGAGFNVDPATLALNDVLIHYLGGTLASGENDDYEDRGLEGLDLADLIDGFICRGHISAAQANAIVADAMGLDFDAAGGPGSCPHPAD